jgi:hypothetical protein
VSEFWGREFYTCQVGLMRSVMVENWCALSTCAVLFESSSVLLRGAPFCCSSTKLGR